MTAWDLLFDLFTCNVIEQKVHYNVCSAVHGLFKSLETLSIQIFVSEDKDCFWDQIYTWTLVQILRVQENQRNDAFCLASFCFPEFCPKANHEDECLKTERVNSFNVAGFYI